MHDVGQNANGSQAGASCVRRPARLFLVFALAIVAMHVFAAGARADTHLSSTTYVADTTWATAGSPYVLDGSIAVAAGATLTIQPGVVVKLNGFQWIHVEGVISAVGTPSSPITFTSIKDDTIGGDSGGDGPTVGAPGDWYMLWVDSTNCLSKFDYANVRFGGLGSFDLNYGALKVTKSAVVSVDHSTFTHNESSGLLVGTGSNPGATVDHSTFSNNGTGVAVNGGYVTLGNNNSLSNNARDGLIINLSGGDYGYTGPQSTITHNEITGNNRYGVNLSVTTSIPASIFPRGNFNNIYDNGSAEISGGGGYSERDDVDWENNYLDSHWEDNDPRCALAEPFADGSQWYNGPPSIKGPLDWGYFTLDNGPYLPPTYCWYDRVKVTQVSLTHIDNSGL
jgi:hypothetical protein